MIFQVRLKRAPNLSDSLSAPSDSMGISSDLVFSNPRRDWDNDSVITLVITHYSNLILSGPVYRSAKTSDSHIHTSKQDNKSKKTLVQRSEHAFRVVWASQMSRLAGRVSGVRLMSVVFREIDIFE